MSASRVINGIAFSLISIFSSCHVIQSKIQVVTNICAVKKEFWILQLVGKISYFFRCLLFLLPKSYALLEPTPKCQLGIACIVAMMNLCVHTHIRPLCWQRGLSLHSVTTHNNTLASQRVRLTSFAQVNSC